MVNAWLTHLKEFAAKHPEMSYKDAMKAAKGTYKPDDSGDDKSKSVKKTMKKSVKKKSNKKKSNKKKTNKKKTAKKGKKGKK